MRARMQEKYLGIFLSSYLDRRNPVGSFGGKLVEFLKKNHMHMQVLEVSAIKLPMRAIKQIVSHLKTLHNLKLVDWHLDEELKPVALEKKLVNMKKHLTYTFWPFRPISFSMKR